MIDIGRKWVNSKGSGFDQDRAIDKQIKALEKELNIKKETKKEYKNPTKKGNNIK